VGGSPLGKDLLSSARVAYDGWMKTRRASWWVRCCLVGGALGGAGLLGESAAVGDKGAERAAASSKGAAWVDYEAPDGLYKARFPAAPQAETQKGVPTLVIARYQTVGGLNSGPMYYVAAMVGKTQNTPPTDLLPGLLAAAEKQGFQPLGVEASDGKPLKDGQGNPGRRLKLTHLKSHRTGIGKVIVNRLTGALLLVAGFGPDAEAFVKSAQFL